MEIKKYFRYFMEKWKETKFKLFVIGIMTTIILGIVLGFGYLLAVGCLALFFFFIAQAEKENEKIISPWKQDEIKQKIEDLENKAQLIREHIQKYDEDLEAKMKLYELEKEIEQLKQQYWIQ